MKPGGLAHEALDELKVKLQEAQDRDNDDVDPFGDVAEDEEELDDNELVVEDED
jgi:hypothetical protein